VTAIHADRLPTIPASGFRGWVQRHPVAAFFVLAYALSWLVWIPAALAGASQLLMVPGAFGPAVAAYLVIRITGGSVRAWARQILHWRVKPRWYLYALGLPALLFAVVNATLALLGNQIDLSLVADRAPSYLVAFAFVALLGGGQEEPGWRGFALPRLQQRLTPLQATLLLAFLWGLWHLPIYGLAFIGPMLFAFPYTYLYNRTGSVGLCMLLHGSFTAALDNLTLTSDSLTVDVTIAAVLLAATLVLIAATRGRLGYHPTPGRRQRREKLMTTAPHAFGSSVAMPTEAVHVTGRRVLATVIDGLIFGVAYWLLALAFGDIRSEGEAANLVSNLPVWTSIAYGLFVIGYYILLEGYLGQTIGKMATGIKVVSEATEQAPGIAAAAIRTVLRIIDGLFSYLVAFITVLASAKRQRLGDMAANTLVVRT
jgi:uncharacterized protein